MKLANRAVLAALLLTNAPVIADVPKPEALVSDGVPPVPDTLAEATRPYMEFRAAGFSGWNVADKSIVVTTRFADTNQLHKVLMPGGARQQLTFEPEPVSASLSPTEALTIVTKDRGGDEFWQLYRLDKGRLALLTDGKSRNSLNAWSYDGKLIGYSSTKRNGTDSDLYVMDPHDPASARMVARVDGGGEGWSIAAFTRDNRRALIGRYVSVEQTLPFMLDLASGKMTPIGDHSKKIAYGDADFAPDGTLWAISDADSDFARLGKLDPASGKFTPVSPEKKWDVDSFALSDNGQLIAYVVNEAGINKLRLMDTRTGGVRDVPGLPAGSIGSVKISPWNEVGFTLSSAKSPSDVYSVDAATLKLRRWTYSETGGLDAGVNSEPQLIEVKSFDGLPVSGFLYRPDPKKFPGKRPMIMSIHGGPESQTQPGFLGRSNYLLNELGIAIFYPNVRGSTGYGKRFVGLDSGPFKREDSVKDVGAFLDVLDKDPALDAQRMAVTGGSYGGYMCYASAIRYGDRFKAALCIVAISNFVTFLENTQGYRRDLRRAEYGDERDATQRAKLIEISPMTSIDKLRIPLFVVTGGNDPRVPPSEADQIVKAVRAKGGTAWHLLGKNEGHGFAKKANIDYQFWSSVQFWQKNLLGGAK